MPVVPLKDVLDRAFKERYGVAAFNIVNDLTLEAVLAAAVDLRAPVIVQTSVKTVKSIGRDVLYGMWRTMTAGIEVPVTLHLDHCPEREVITSCLEGGWNSVLFDASSLPVEENQRQTKEVVAEARRLRRARRGRDRRHQGRRGRRRLGRRVHATVARRRAGFHPGDGDRLLRARDRQRARDVRERSDARRAARDRHRRGGAHPDRAARRQRDDRRAVRRPDRARLREGEHLHGAQAPLHEVQPRVSSARRRRPTSGTRRRCSRTFGPTSSTWRRTTSGGSGARARRGDRAHLRLRRGAGRHGT